MNTSANSVGATPCRRCGTPREAGRQCLPCRRRRFGSAPLHQINAPDWLTLSKAAPILGVSVDTLRRQVRRGDVESRLVQGRNGPTYVVRLSALDPSTDIGHLIDEHDDLVAEADVLMASVPRRIWGSFAIGVFTGGLAVAIPVVALYLRGMP